MMSSAEEQESLAAALALVDDRAFQVEIAQVRARAALEELPGDPDHPDWTYIEARVVRNATAGLLALKHTSLNGGLEENVSQALAVARFWEGFAKLNNGPARATSLSNAATSYELAGYQANAACLAKGLGDVERSDPQLADLSAAFLRRLFVALRDRGLGPLAQPDVEAVAQALDRPTDAGREGDSELANRAALAAASAGLRDAARFFLAGVDERLETSDGLLALAERGYIGLGLVVEANLVASLRSLLPAMASRSTWHQLAEYARADPRWSRYLKLLARGLGSDPYSASSVSELWPSQREALSSGLLSDHDSKMVRLPTSAGKTRIAELAMVRTLLEDSEARCIYVAPYRALVTEIERGLFSLFADLGIQVASITGSYDSDALEMALAGGSRVLVVTPEKLDLLSRLDEELLASARLLVLDEGHLIGDLTRGPRLDLMVSRFKLAHPDLRILMLSAVVSDETLADFAEWLDATSNDVVELEWRPAIQRVAMLDWRGPRATLRYAREGESGLLPEFVPGVSQRQTYRFRHRETRRVRQPTFPEAGSKAQMAADAAFRFAQLGPVLVFCSQTNYVRGVARALEARLEIARHIDEALPSYFETANTRASLAAAEWLGEDHEAARFLRQGIAFHHGQLADVIRQAVELDFRQRRYRILVATNTLAQGVNLPLRTVVVHSVWRRDEVGNASRLPVRDYWNIAGRAGRAGEETEGSILHLVTNSLDVRDYQHYVAAPRQTDVESALFVGLKALVDDRISEEALADGLDPEILALLVEEAGPETVATLVENVLDATLAATQAQRRGIDREPLRRVIVNRAQRITETVEDRSLLPLYSSTGLTSAGCEALRSTALERASDLRALLTGARDDLIALATVCLQACEEVEEVAPTADFAGSYAELLAEWLGGTDIDEMRARFGEEAGGPDQLSKLIDDFFGYRLPWGVNSFVRIATAVLAIPADGLIQDARFLPSMIKHGVPLAAASWAVTAGIPSRRLALEVAIAYVSEAERISYPNFLSWLADLEPDEFRDRFGVSGDLIDDLAVALDRTRVNPLLLEQPDALDILPTEVTVSGAGRADRFSAAAEAGVGASLVVRREYGDPISRNAISLRLDGQLLGFVPRREAQLLAPEIDCGAAVTAEIAGVDTAARRVTARMALTT